MALTLLICFIILLLCAAAYLSASETALFSLSPMRLKTYGHSQKPRHKLVHQLTQRPRDLLVTLFICNILANIILQNLFSSHAGSNWWIKVGAPLGLTLVFGEILPKSIAFSNNEKIAIHCSPYIYKIYLFLTPVRKVLTYITSRVAQVMFFFLKKEKGLTKDQLHLVLHSSLKNGVLTKDEAHLIDGYLTLQENSVKELMRPREDVLYYDMNDPLSKLIDLMATEKCSRVPVCRGDLQEIIGVLSARQFLLNRHRISTPSQVTSFLQKPYFVPEATSAKILLRHMTQRDKALAIVVDEYGSISGLIAREDLVEAIVGEITDKRDHKARFTRSGDDVIIASGKLELSEFEDLFGIPLRTQDNVVTLGGWLTEQMSDIPKTGSQLTKEGFYFQVLAADPHRVRRVYIRRLKGGK